MTRSVSTVPQGPSAPARVDPQVLRLIDMAIAEDRGEADWTSRWTVPAKTQANAEIVSKAEGVIAGIIPATAVFLRVDRRIDAELLVADGERVTPGVVICRLTGPARALLTGERVALNFLQRLSGVATLTRRFVDAVAGTGVRILDTRKTTPGWRALEKAAVRAGGGQNHRLGLYDAILIKNNHISVAGSLTEAVTRVRAHNTRQLPVIVEVHSLDELDPALDAGADRVLLDNLEVTQLTLAVRRARSRTNPPALEASGNMTLDRVREVAETGVDFISIGTLTHSAPALDLSVRLIV